VGSGVIVIVGDGVGVRVAVGIKVKVGRAVGGGASVGTRVGVGSFLGPQPTNKLNTNQTTSHFQILKLRSLLRRRLSDTWHYTTPFVFCKEDERRGTKDEF
jgi:hypothetical protein